MRKAGKKVRCKHCGDIIQSKHRWDFVECKCGKIFVDGGSDYLRIGWPCGEPEEHLEFIKNGEDNE
jgi:phage FluMu protein Com